MAIRESSIRSRAGYGAANLQSEGRRRSTQSDISWRPAAAIASLAVAAAVLGGAIWTAQFVPKKTISVATAPVSVADEVTPSPVAPEAEVRTGAIDAVTPSTTAGAAEINPGATARIQNMPSDNPPDQGAAASTAMRLASAAVDDRAPGSEGPKTAPPLVAPDMVAVREPVLGEIRKDDESAANGSLFREFLQWQAARRVSGVTPSARQNAAKSQHRLRPAAAVPMLAATNPQPRSTKPASAPEAPAVPPAVARPRRPHLSSTQTHATIERQVAPASASANARSY